MTDHAQIEHEDLATRKWHLRQLEQSSLIVIEKPCRMNGCVADLLRAEVSRLTKRLEAWREFWAAEAAYGESLALGTHPEWVRRHRAARSLLLSLGETP